MAPATKDELMNLINVLGMNRMQFAHFCAVSANTVGWWLKEGNVPKFRFERVARGLDKRIADQTLLTFEQKKAKALVERVMGMPLAVIVASGSVTSPTSKSAFNSEKEGVEYRAGPIQPLSTNEGADQNDQSLLNFTDQELVRELERRGWSVSLGLKGKV